MLIDRVRASTSLWKPEHAALARTLEGCSGMVIYIDQNGDLTNAFDRWGSTDEGIGFQYDRHRARLTVDGSPALLVGSKDAVMGSSAAAVLDVDQCVAAVTSTICDRLQLDKPIAPSDWNCTAIDVTQNLFCGNRDTAQDIILSLSAHRFSYQSMAVRRTWVTWGGRGAMFRPKIYMKGPAVRRRRQHSAKIQGLLDPVLRFELQLAAPYLSKYGLPSAATCKALHLEKFSAMKTHAQRSLEYESAVEAIRAEYGRLQASGLIAFYRCVKAEGYALARHRTGDANFYRKLAQLRAIGIDLKGEAGYADFQEEKPARLLVPVDTWEELEAVTDAYERGVLQTSGRTQ